MNSTHTEIKMKYYILILEGEDYDNGLFIRNATLYSTKEKAIKDIETQICNKFCSEEDEDEYVVVLKKIIKEITDFFNEASFNEIFGKVDEIYETQTRGFYFFVRIIETTLK